MIKAGDRVTIKPEWRDTGDDLFTFVAIEDEDGGRVRIGVLDCLTSFVPQQVVLVEWLDTTDS